MKSASIIILNLSLLVATTIYAASGEQLVNAKKGINDLEKTIDAVKSKSKFPVLFPEKIPVSDANEKLYASASVETNGDYVINIDATPECEGAKFCNTGSVTAKSGRHAEIYRTKDGKKLTKVITLADGNKINYTPAHAEADFWPTMVEWEEGNVLYNISWKLDQKGEEKVMLAIAESVVIK